MSKHIRWEREPPEAPPEPARVVARETPRLPLARGATRRAERLRAMQREAGGAP